MSDELAKQIADELEERRANRKNGAGGYFTGPGSPWWARLIEVVMRQFGFASLICIFLGILIWHWGPTVHNEWLAPIRNKHFLLIDVATEQLPKQTKILEELRGQTSELKETNRMLFETHQVHMADTKPRDVLEQTKKNTEVLRQIRDAIIKEQRDDQN